MDGLVGLLQILLGAVCLWVQLEQLKLMKKDS